MAFNNRNRSLLSLVHHTERDLLYLLDLARDLKRAKYSGTERPASTGKNIALIFEKTSTRTRCAFEVAAYDEGAHVTYIDPTSSQIGHKESMKDTARVLGPDVRRHRVPRRRPGDRRGARRVRRRAGVQRAHRRVPPDPDARRRADHDRALRQAVARHRLSPIVGDGRNNMANSLLLVGAKLGMDVRIGAPKELWPTDEHVALCRGLRRRVRRPDHHHRRPEGGGHGCRLHPHRRLGVDGRAGRDLGRADRRAAAVPGQRRADGGSRQSAGAVHALPAGVPQLRDQGRRADRRAVPVPRERHRGHRRRLRESGEHRVRTGREPDAHHQGGPRGRRSA